MFRHFSPLGIYPQMTYLPFANYGFQKTGLAGSIGNSYQSCLVKTSITGKEIGKNQGPGAVMIL